MYASFLFSSNYSAEIAPVGHSPSQVPHSRHASASITYFPSPSLIASAGHASAHVPQLTHSSEITYAIIDILLIILFFATSHTDIVCLHSNTSRMIIQVKKIFNVKFHATNVNSSS